MGKIAFLFPGQGSQEVGMGSDLFKDDAYFRGLIEYGSAIVEQDLETLCLKGPEKKLVKAAYLQPLLVALSLGYLRYLREAGIEPDMVLGHSLGEITSLAASGVVSDREAVAIAAKRGQLMDEAASRCDGTMMAVLFVPINKVEEILVEMGVPDKIVLANDNAPDQVVVSGDSKLLDQFAHWVSHEKIGKTKKLLVSGPWHSPFITSARVAFEQWAEPVPFANPRIPIVLNATAKGEIHPTTIKHLVTWQLTAPVFWRECMETVKAAGVDTLLEIGPGRVLSGLARVNGFRGQTAIFNVNNLRGAEQAIAALKPAAA